MSMFTATRLPSYIANRDPEKTGAFSSLPPAIWQAFTVKRAFQLATPRSLNSDVGFLSSSLPARVDR